LLEEADRKRLPDDAVLLRSIGICLDPDVMLAHCAEGADGIWRWKSSRGSIEAGVTADQKTKFQT
jgi:hypothetical protein